MADSISTTGPSHKLNQKYLRAAATVSQALEALVRKHETGEGQGTLIIDELHTTRKYLWELLLSRVLPRLGQQINLLTYSLQPGKLRQDPVTHLTRILVVEPALDHTLAQIFSAVDFLCPDPIHIAPPTDDQHLKEFKFFRLAALKTDTNFLRGNLVSGFLRQACAIVEELVDLSKTNASGYDKQQRRMAKTYLVLAEEARTVLNSIQAIQKWLSASELDLVLDWWECWILDFDDALVRCTRVIAGPADGGSVVDAAVIHLAKSIIPLIKLTRLFFRKLTKIGMDDIQRRPVFTDLSSKQLEAYKWSPSGASHAIQELLDALKAVNASGSRRGLLSHSWIPMAENLCSHLESCCRKIVQSFVPLIPVITDARTLDQNYVTSPTGTFYSSLPIATLLILQHPFFIFRASLTTIFRFCQADFFTVCRDLFLSFSVPHYPFLAL